MYVRDYCSKEDSEGHDEGGYYRMIEVEPMPDKLKKRLDRCIGCYNNFYNHRANCGGINHCFSLDDDDAFRGKGQPKCWRRG